MPYIYNDEDNSPMIESEIDRLYSDENVHHVTGYFSLSEARAAERYEVPEGKPEDGCWNCMNFDWTREACTIGWNNMDESYYNPNCDDHDPTDWCEYHDLDPDVKPEDWDFGGNEP